MADGDGRYLLTLAETLFNIGSAKPLDTKALGQVLQKRSPPTTRTARSTTTSSRPA
jgi:putative ATPase